MHTVLIVDDNKDIRDLIKHCFEFEGYSILEAENGKIAQSKLDGPARPCIVFLDLMMLVMDGRQFLEWSASTKNIRTSKSPLSPR